MGRLALYIIGRAIPVLALAVVASASGSNLMYMGGYSDPFAPYEAMMPGQIVMATGDQLCEPQVVPGYVDTISCEVHPTDGHFNLVTANISNSRFVQISFSANNLYIGDMAGRWGRPDVIVKNDQAFYVYWNNQGLYGIVDPVGVIGRYSYMLPVESLTIGLQSQDHPLG